MTEYTLRIKLVGGTSYAHPTRLILMRTFGHSWSYFDIQNLRLVILYLPITSGLSGIILPTYVNFDQCINILYFQLHQVQLVVSCHHI